jgi:DNA ligase D-like protein (predicted ligase)
MSRRFAERLPSLPAREAGFIEPMECLPVATLPLGSPWSYEIKLDGYRALAVKSHGSVSLYSRRRKSFNPQYPDLVDALSALPDNTVLDGEVVALDDSGRPSFHLLQEFRKDPSRIHYFVFDLLICEGRDLTGLRLGERRELLRQLKESVSRVRVSEEFDVAKDILTAARQQKLAGVIAKRKDSVYQAGARSGAWCKYRVNRGQELVIGGYMPGAHGIDSLIVGYYREDKLLYVARVRNGFVPAIRRHVFERIRGLVSPTMPFANLPEKGRWGDALTRERMNRCIWVRPETVAQIEFREWTAADRLRHAKFVALREDKDPRTVVKEYARE